MSLVGRTNLITNPIGANVAASTNLAFVRSTAAVMAGFLRATITDAGATNLNQRIQPSASTGIAGTPGKVYTMIGEGRSDVTVPSLALNIQFLNSGGGVISNAAGTATTVNATSSTFTTLSTASGTAPANTAFVLPQLGIPGVGARAIGQIFDLRRLLIEETTSGAYFDGGFTNTANLTYSWAGTPELSRSFETQTVRRAVNSITQQSMQRAATI